MSFPEIEKFDRLPPARVQGASAFVSIMGVQQVLQLLRRALHARRRSVAAFDDVVAEVAGLAEQGVKEVTLLGQNVNAWRGAIAGAPAFAELLYYLDEVPGLERIRYTTSHPRNSARG